ncbi:serine protease [uncultured Tateyamaria sp.]|uniref:trypsin-like serine peptidase n=1 Tax=uncultured Tateyamaria sp. TaxID=455651 RepID=UPI00262F81BD|nr:serine protease [uncultured Tateyamaria sp.]
MPITPEDLGLDNLADSIGRLQARKSKWQLALHKIAKGNGRALESDQRKLKAELRQMALDEAESNAEDDFLILTPGLGQEANIGKRDNILSGEFLEIGILTARSVCRISQGLKTGTGFLVGNGIVVTNYHVIKSKTEAASSLFEFLFDDNSIGTPRSTEMYAADTDHFFWADEALDICFLGLQGVTDISTFGWLPLLREEGKALIGDPTNIIQHPAGQKKRIVVHDSVFSLVDNDTDADAFCWYSGDTNKGSSGAPVLNNRWEVLAVHHKAIPDTDVNGHVLDINGKKIAKERLDENNAQVRWLANEGIRVSRIVDKLEAQTFPDDPGYVQVRDDLLALWSDPLATDRARRASFAGMEKQL